MMVQGAAEKCESPSCFCYDVCHSTGNQTMAALHVPLLNLADGYILILYEMHGIILSIQSLEILKCDNRQTEKCTICLSVLSLGAQAWKPSIQETETADSQVQGWLPHLPLKKAVLYSYAQLDQVTQHIVSS